MTPLTGRRRYRAAQQQHSRQQTNWGKRQAQPGDSTADSKIASMEPGAAPTTCSLRILNIRLTVL